MDKKEGDFPRCSPRLKNPENKPAKKQGRKSSSSKESNRKDNNNQDTEASDEEKRDMATARVIEKAQTRSDMEMEKAEDGRDMNKDVHKSEVLSGGECLDILEAGSKDENEEKITNSSRKTKCSETGNKMDSYTKEVEMNTAEEQNEVQNQERKEKIMLGELHAPPGWTKKLDPVKGQTSKIVFISPTGEVFNNKNQLKHFLKSNPGGHAFSEFYWGTGDFPRHSPRLINPVNEQAKKRERKASSSKDANRKDNNNEETKASNEEKRVMATARVAEVAQTRSDVELEKTEGGRDMNTDVPKSGVVSGGECLDILEAGSKDENEEKITNRSRKIKCSETGNKMDSYAKEVEMNTAEEQTEVQNKEKEEKIMLGELHAPPGWTKKLSLEKGHTSKRNEIVFISPRSEKIKNKRQLNQFLKSNPGGPAFSEFSWVTGDTHGRRSPRLIKSKPVGTLENEPPKKHGNRKDSDDEKTKAPDEEKSAIATSRFAVETQTSDVEMTKAENRSEKNEKVANGEALPVGESGNIVEAGLKDVSKLDFNTMEEEISNAEQLTEVENQGNKEQIISTELHAPLGWTKKIIPKKCQTSKRSEIVFISPTGEVLKNKTQLKKCLNSQSGSPASSEFYWGTGNLPRRSARLCKSRPLAIPESSVSEFGDDRFSVVNWVNKDIISRDGQMKLGAHVFFASIDQRSESAGGHSACAVLAVVIANWFQTDQDSMPTESQFDKLIREGSLEWRNICEDQTIKNRFPDKHLDLETVFQANIRPVSKSIEKSFVSFFFVDGMDEGAFSFLKPAKSFDHIWDEIISCAEKNCYSGGGPQVYIVSWNDHFFILKVEAEAYYLMDTLGEMLYEGCDQAFILKFDKDTVVHKLHKEVVKETETVNQLMKAETEKETATVPQQSLKEDLIAKVESGKKEDILCDSKESGKQENFVCQGKESCKEYFKSFLAAVPIRDLLVNSRKGERVLERHLRILQIEFHYVEFLLPNT